MKIAIVFGTKYGATEKASKLLMDELVNRGVEVDLYNLAKAKPNIINYDGIILGGSVYMGKIRGNVKSFIEKNRNVLIEKTIGVFIVGGADTEAAINDEINNNYPSEILEKAKVKSSFGHEYNLEKMGFINKFIIKKVAKLEESQFKINNVAIVKFAEEVIA